LKTAKSAILRQLLTENNGQNGVVKLLNDKANPDQLVKVLSMFCRPENLNDVLQAGETKLLELLGVDNLVQILVEIQPGWKNGVRKFLSDNANPKQMFDVLSMLNPLEDLKEVLEADVGRMKMHEHIRDMLKLKDSEISDLTRKKFTEIFLKAGFEKAQLELQQAIEISNRFKSISLKEKENKLNEPDRTDFLLTIARLSTDISLLSELFCAPEKFSASILLEMLKRDDETDDETKVSFIKGSDRLVDVLSMLSFVRLINVLIAGERKLLDSLSVGNLVKMLVEKQFKETNKSIYLKNLHTEKNGQNGVLKFLNHKADPKQMSDVLSAWPP
jgi:hypothetical protein